MTALHADARRLLDFWFDEPTRPFWFKKDADFDVRLSDGFLGLHHAAARREHDAWAETALGALALVIALDQLPRNLFRGSPHAFATDARALEVARLAVDRGFDATMPTHDHRLFLYLPFEHSESREDQARSLALFEATEQAFLIDYARRHKVIVDRFGRFPHRNHVLGRVTTDEEAAFLKEPGSSF